MELPLEPCCLQRATHLAPSTPPSHLVHRAVVPVPLARTRRTRSGSRPTSGRVYWRVLGGVRDISQLPARPRLTAQASPSSRQFRGELLRSSCGGASRRRGCLSTTGRRCNIRSWSRCDRRVGDIPHTRCTSFEFRAGVAIRCTPGSVHVPDSWRPRDESNVRPAP